MSAGSGLIYADEYGTIPFDNQFPTNTRLYKILSTKFGEVFEKGETNAEYGSQ